MEAYQVPFEVTRGEAVVQLVNRGPTALRWVRLIAHGNGVAVSRPLPVLAPGGRIEVRLVGERLSRDTLLVIQWLRDDGEAYLTTVAL